MDRIKDYFKGRTLGFWLAFGTAALAFVLAIVFVIVYNTALAGDRAFSALTVVFMIIGALAVVAGEAFDLKFMPIVGGAFYAVAVGLHFQLSAYPFADALTGVPFFGGNPAAAMVFGIFFALCAIANIVSAFFDHRTN